jgi:hypothetical protein
VHAKWVLCKFISEFFQTNHTCFRRSRQHNTLGIADREVHNFDKCISEHEVDWHVSRTQVHISTQQDVRNLIHSKCARCSSHNVLNCLHTFAIAQCLAPKLPNELKLGLLVYAGVDYSTWTLQRFVILKSL